MRSLLRCGFSFPWFFWVAKISLLQYSCLCKGNFFRHLPFDHFLLVFVHSHLIVHFLAMRPQRYPSCIMLSSYCQAIDIWIFLKYSAAFLSLSSVYLSFPSFSEVYLSLSDTAVTPSSLFHLFVLIAPLILFISLNIFPWSWIIIPHYFHRAHGNNSSGLVATLCAWFARVTGKKIHCLLLHLFIYLYAVYPYIRFDFLYFQSTNKSDATTPNYWEKDEPSEYRISCWQLGDCKKSLNEIITISTANHHQKQTCMWGMGSLRRPQRMNNAKTNQELQTCSLQYN